jgi:hypothetical protein
MMRDLRPILPAELAPRGGVLIAASSADEFQRRNDLERLARLKGDRIMKICRRKVS